jgi:lambda family phage portal protein
MNFKLELGRAKFSFGNSPKQELKRSFAAANMTRLNADWLMPQTSADAEIASGLVNLRGRARELERNNEYVQRYLSLIDNNVLGNNGVGLQMKIADPTGTLDKMANQVVLAGWREWTQRKNCTPSGTMCWRDVEGLALRRAACDGGILIQLVRGWQNKFAFAVQPLEMDHLAHEHNVKLSNGNEIKFGIETDPWRRLVAFYLYKQHPGDGMNSGRELMRVPASDILHVYWAERPGQTVGVPWFTCVMQSLEHLGKYREAELVAARLEACKGYAIKQPTPDGFSGQRDSNGEPLQEMSPGMGLLLQPGEEYVAIAPTHPNQAFGDFIKSALRGIAGGLSVNYNSLANDLESVNYSSMRAGKLEEVEEYKNIQSWLIESLHVPVFSAWLEQSLIKGALRMGNGSALPVGKFDKFNAPDWKPRRWPWVDPLKDLQASVLAVEKGFKSRREIISEMGGDVEKVFLEQSEDEALAETYDLEFPLGSNPQQPQETGNDTEDDPPSKLTPPE